jgi:hypothetical protein
MYLHSKQEVNLLNKKVENLMRFDNGVERDENWRTSPPPPQTCMLQCACGLQVATRRCTRNSTVQNYTFNIHLLSVVLLIVNVTIHKQFTVTYYTCTP